MKYSLRSLMIAITLVCVMLGGAMGRIDYLRRWAAYHEREEQHWLDRLSDLTPRDPHRFGIDKAADDAAFASARHRRLKEAYWIAVYRPWAAVDDPEVSP